MELISSSQALVIWLANKGSGQYRDLKECINWLSRTGIRSDVQIWAVINGLQNLGYIRQTSDGLGWEALGQKLVMLPGREGLAMVSGCFDRKHFERSALKHELWTTFIPASTDAEINNFLPDTIYLEATTVDGFRQYQEQTFCEYIDVESEIMELHKKDPLSLVNLAAPPRYYTNNLERFDLNDLSYKPCTDGSKDGLYRQRVNGILNYWVRHDDAWFRTDRGKAPWIWRNFSRISHDASSMVWYRSKTESIYFSSKVALPAKLESLLTLCAGVLPAKGRTSRRFDNVDLSLRKVILDYLKIDPDKGY